MKAKDIFSHLQTLSAGELHARRRTIIDEAKKLADADGTASPYKKIDSDGLRELAVIYSLLRVKGTKPEAKSKTKTPAASAMDLI